MNQAAIGFLRGVGAAVVIAILTYVGDASNLAFLNPVTASIIASLALALEHQMASNSGKALFGAVTIH